MNNDDRTIFHSTMKVIRRVVPNSIASFMRSWFTALYTPIYFSFLSGHFKSSLKKKSVSRKNDSLPWYTYPAIDFLRTRSFVDKTIVEFGGGQSSLWWSKHAQRVITFEDNKAWFDSLKKQLPPSVELFLVSNESRVKCATEVNQKLEDLNINQVDILVIDGLFREEMVEIACKYVSPGGAIICDNAEGFGFYENFLDRHFSRVDFYGHAPGVMLPHSTSIYFKEQSFLFDAHQIIPTQD